MRNLLLLLIACISLLSCTEKQEINKDLAAGALTQEQAEIVMEYMEKYHFEYSQYIKKIEEDSMTFDVSFPLQTINLKYIDKLVDLTEELVALNPNETNIAELKDLKEVQEKVTATDFDKILEYNYAFDTFLSTGECLNDTGKVHKIYKVTIDSNLIDEIIYLALIRIGDEIVIDSDMVLFQIHSALVNSTIKIYSEKEKDWAESNLYGKVKSVRKFSFYVNENAGEYEKDIERGERHQSVGKMFSEEGKLTKDSWYDKEGKLRRSIIYKHDTRGNMIEEAWCNADGSVDEKKVFTYDKDNNLIEEILSRSEDKSKRRYLYKYDANNYLIEKKVLEEDDGLIMKIVYKNNKKTNISQEITYNPDGSISVSTSYLLDDRGNVLQSFYGLPGSSEYYKYDERGNMLEMKLGSSGPNPRSRNILRYDKRDNIIEEYWSFSYGNEEYLTVFKYKFDKRGNWIEKLEICDGVPDTIFEREIEYYN